MLPNETSIPRRAKGSVIVLVVAVLALLAIIGTVYIVSARSQRSTAEASNTAVNLDYAQKSVNEAVQRTIGDALLDPNGTLAGGGTSGPYGFNVSRNFDIPERSLAIPPNLAGSTFGTSYFGNNQRDQAWLCGELYPSAATWPPPADTTAAAGATPTPSAYLFNNMTLLDSAYMFDPTTGLPNPNFSYYNFVGLPNPPMFTIVPPPGSTGFNPDAFIQLLPFSDAGGVRYRFGIRIIDASSMANLNVGMANAASSTQLTNGTYFNSYQIDTSNTNNGPFVPPDTASSINGVPGAANAGRWGITNIGGTASPDYFWQMAMLYMENPQTKLPINAFDLADELELRSYGDYGTLAGLRPGTLWTNTLSNHNSTATITRNKNRPFYTAYSYSRDLRPYLDPPYPGVGVTAPRYTMLPSGGWSSLYPPGATNLAAYDDVWPAYPAPVAANIDISTYGGNGSYSANNDAATVLAVSAVNLATAMERIAGYSTDEARAFMVNYLTYRWNNWSGGAPYAMVAGPSSLDDSTNPGTLCFTATGSNINFNLTNLTTGTPKIRLGFAAQPFINELAIAYKYDGTNNTTSYLGDSAIEIYNPFDFDLSLADYALSIDGGTRIAFTGASIKARSYYVITTLTAAAEPNGLAKRTVTGNADQTETTLDLHNGSKVYLMRRYIDSAGTTQWAAVDEYIGTNLKVPAPPPMATGTDKYVAAFLEKANNDDPLNLAMHSTSHWVGAVYDYPKAEAIHTDDDAPNYNLTLGAPNDAKDDRGKYIPLVDPFTSRGVLKNLIEFSNIMRICNEVDPIPTGMAGHLPITDSRFLGRQLSDVIAFPTAGGTDFPEDASVHFDFRGGAPAGTGQYKPGDNKAVKLLQCISFSDRVSDYTIDLGDNSTWTYINGTQVFDKGLSKLRVPGKINVNTAPGSVLATIPTFSANPAFVGAVMAYRWRTKNNDPRIPAAFQSGTLIDFSNPNDYPGYGIQTMAELEIPFAKFQTALGFGVGASALTTHDRDVFWGTVVNMLTTRSDTFVLYAYLEAVKQNPRYSGASPIQHLPVSASGPAVFDNATDWYLNYPANPASPPTYAAVTDDPNDTYSPLLRLGRRRWIAIIDRSQSNYGRQFPIVDLSGTPPNMPFSATTLDPRFTLPKIVAQRDLPE